MVGWQREGSRVAEENKDLSRVSGEPTLDAGGSTPDEPRESAPLDPIFVPYDPSAVLLEKICRELQQTEPSTAERLRELGRVALADDAPPSEVITWSGVDLFRAFDPDVIASSLNNFRWRWVAWVVSSAEFARNFLVFVPVMLTWIGLGKAGAVYATCAVDAQTSPQEAVSKTQFLYLWQNGFRVSGVTCDTNSGATYGLPLDSFGEVVFADFLALGAVLLLTIFTQIFSTLRTTSTDAAANRLADQLRSVLIECTRRLQGVRSAEDTSALVVQASENLREVANDFSRQARQMIDVLQARSAEADRRMDEMTISYRDVATQAVTAARGLETSLSAVRETVTELAATSAISAASVNQAALQLGQFAGKLDMAADAVRAVDANVIALRAVEEGALNERKETAKAARAIAGQVGVLADIDLGIRNLRGIFRKDRLQLPVPAWQLGVAALVGQFFFQLVTVILVVVLVAWSAGLPLPLLERPGSTGTPMATGTASPTAAPPARP
jgi:hypothetical protein